jgi:hypothetical protein
MLAHQYAAPAHQPDRYDQEYVYWPRVSWIQSINPNLVHLIFPPDLIESSDPEFDDYNRKFTAIEAGTEKILKDSKVFRDAVQTLLYSGSSFSTSFNTLFAPLGAEYDLGSKFPNSEVTIRNIGGYQALMEDLRGESWRVPYRIGRGD